MNNRSWLKFFIIAINALIVCQINSQAQQFLNLNFEQLNEEDGLPKNWMITTEDNCIFSPDSTIMFSGKRSLKLSPQSSGEDCNAIMLNELSASLFKGKQLIDISVWISPLTLGDSNIICFIKQLDSTGKEINNWSNKAYIDSSVNNWRRLHVREAIDSRTQFLAIGIKSSNRNSCWIDDFQLVLDGVPYTEAFVPAVLPSDNDKRWLVKNIRPVKMVKEQIDAGNLATLENNFKNYRTIALGEVTHGSSEVYELKSSVIKYLIEQIHFKIIGLELDMAETELLNDYVVNNRGNPREVLFATSYWPWQTEEFLNLLKWINIYNQKNREKVHLMGFDLPYSVQSIQALCAYSKQCDTHLYSLADKLKTTYLTDYSNTHNDESVYHLVNQIRAVLQYLHTHKRNFIQKSSEYKYRWNMRNMMNLEASIKSQLYPERESYYRDSCMAENVNWILENNRSSKVILWGHNNHIAKSGRSMGGYIQKKNNLFCIAFSLGQGSFNAVSDSTRRISTFLLPPLISDTYESFFLSINQSFFYLNLHNATIGDNWIHMPHFLRITGGKLMRYQFWKTTLDQDFDAVFFIKNSTPSHLLQ